MRSARVVIFRLLLALILATSFTLGLHSARAAYDTETLTLQVNASGNDWLYTSFEDTYTSTSDLYVVASSAKYYSFVKFTGLSALPDGAVIESITLSLYAGTSYGEDENDGYGNVGYVNVVAPFDQSLTSADMDESTSGLTWTSFDADDLSSGWVNVSALGPGFLTDSFYAFNDTVLLKTSCVWLEPDGPYLRSFKSYDYSDHSYGAKLYIVYHVATGSFVEKYQGYTIYGYSQDPYENFYDNYTAVNNNNGYLAVSAENPYIITLDAFGFDSYWDKAVMYFRRDNDFDLNGQSKVNSLDVRFCIYTSDRDTDWTSPDFWYCNVFDDDNSAYYIHAAHYTAGKCICGWDNTIPPSGSGSSWASPSIVWARFLWDTSISDSEINAYWWEQTLPPSSWSTGYDGYWHYDLPVEWTGKNFSDSFRVLESKTGEFYYEGWTDGYVGYMTINVNGLNQIFDDWYTIEDPDGDDCGVEFETLEECYDYIRGLSTNWLDVHFMDCVGLLGLVLMCVSPPLFAASVKSRQYYVAYGMAFGFVLGLAFAMAWLA